MPQSRSPSSSRGSRSRKATTRRSKSSKQQSSGIADGVAGVIEQLVNRILKPLDIVMISRQRIQETLDDAAERGRMTRSDANELVAELFRRGRQQTDELLGEFERLFARGRDQLGSARNRARRSDSVDQIVRVADRARRAVGAAPSPPISGYDDLTASQVTKRLADVSRQELRRIREYESRHANRKSVLDAIDRQLR
jgi:polyhydroxyalkanoate synthesis regulator phasin